MFKEETKSHSFKTKSKQGRIFYACYPHPKFPAISITGEACALNCKHCLPVASPIMTDSGSQSIGSIFEQISKGSEVRVLTHKGRLKKVTKALKHSHNGTILMVKPSHLPPFECTPVHEVFATPSLYEEPKLVQAKDLKVGNYLWVPAPKSRKNDDFIDLKQILPHEIKSVSRPRKLNRRKVKKILSSEASSFELGKELGLSPSYIRHIRKRLRDGTIAGDGSRKRTIRLIENKGRVKYAGGKIWAPRFLKLERIARLLGYYCSEGDISRHNRRPNSLFARLSFGNRESELIKDSRKLVEENFHVRSRVERGKTRSCVVIPGTPIARMFMSLCGRGAPNKNIPPQILSASTKAIRAFLRGLIDGDGSRTWDKEKRRRIRLGSTSKKLILDCIVLFSRLGYIPSFTARVQKRGEIEGRPIYHRTPTYSISLRGWLAEKAESEIYGTQRTRRAGRRHYITRNGGFLLKVRKIERSFFKGDVFDLEVKDDHSFTCPHAAVSNCRGHYLKHMISCPTPEVLYETCSKLASDGARGVLLSGGHNTEGYVPFEPFVDAIRRVKEETGLFISIHPGVMPSRLAREFSEAGVDMVSFAMIGSDETLEYVLGIKRGAKDYERTLRMLIREIPHVATHICVGLHEGRLKGERKALSAIEGMNISALVFLVIIPTPGTSFEKVQPPSPTEVGELIAEARLKFPRIPLTLGCMRPRGNDWVETELQAIGAGIDRIVIPSTEAVKVARRMGLEVRQLGACCGVPNDMAEAWSRG